jgi:hypothetical protein
VYESSIFGGTVFPKEAKLVALRNKLMATGLAKTEWNEYVLLLRSRRFWRSQEKHGA